MKTLSKVLKKKVAISGFSADVIGLIALMILTITISFSYKKVGWISLIFMFFALVIIYIPILILLYNSLVQKYRYSVKTIIMLGVFLLVGFAINALPLIISFENNENNYIPFAIADENKIITETDQENFIGNITSNETTNIDNNLYKELDEIYVDSLKYEKFDLSESVKEGNVQFADNLKSVFPLKDRASPTQPILENSKPVVELISEDSSTMYVGESKEIFINVFDKDSIENILLLKKDIIVSDESVLSAEYMEDEDKNLSIIITGQTDGYATIQLPEGFAVDSQNNTSDASNILEFEVINQEVDQELNISETDNVVENLEVVVDEIEISDNDIVTEEQCDAVNEKEIDLTKRTEIETCEISQENVVVLEKESSSNSRGF